MSNWNQHYTQRKQKEMMDKALADEKKKNELKPLYAQTMYGNNSLRRKKKQYDHDKFCWRVGFAIMAVMTGLFIWGMIEIL